MTPRPLSKFGQNLCEGSGIGELMEDLGEALAGGKDLLMLGGGQPAHIPEVDAVWRRRMEEIMSEPGLLEQVLGNYDVPAGSLKFREVLSEFFNDRYGWQTKPENFAITMGGQTAFFFLFNALAGVHEDGTIKKILLPVLPEYIGYADQGVDASLFEAVPGKIEKTGRHRFKYRVNFEAIKPGPETAAICVSRPTNPSGNVLTDPEIEQLRTIARKSGIPLIIDSAYGLPFPGILFREATPVWDEGMILTLSLSKIGLPGTRTGIVIADEETCARVASMTSIVGLSNNNLGQEILRPLVQSGEILDLSEKTIRHFYEERSQQAQEWFGQYLPDDLAWFLHESEGALFLWLWLEGCPVPAKTLYELLKNRGVLVVPGSYFFFGEGEPSQHAEECLRVSFAGPPKVVEEGIRRIGELLNELIGADFAP